MDIVLPDPMEAIPLFTARTAGHGAVRPGEHEGRKRDMRRHEAFDADIGTSLISKILDHRLRQSDIRNMLEELSDGGKEQFLDKVSSMLGSLTALLGLTNRLSTSLSLDMVLKHLVEATTEALNAERGTIFLNDKDGNELFSRVAMGDLTQEIRFPNHLGIAGTVFRTGEPIIIPDAYADPRFNREMDKKTGYRTRNILTTPVRNRNGEVIGVVQLLNKTTGDFNESDLTLLDAIATQAAASLQNAQLYEQLERARQEEHQLYECTKAICSELQLTALLQKIMETTSAILEADRSTLFLHDEKTGELWSVVAQGLDKVQIRFPCRLGIAGSVFTTGQTVNIPDAYEDPRFNPEVDKKSGYRTRSILCTPIVNKEGKIIGVTQVLNKKGGPFTHIDENRLKAFSAQASISIENSRLFEDVLNIKNYNECILQSLSNGVITLNENMAIEKCNAAGLRILGLEDESITGLHISEVFSGDSSWVVDAVSKVLQSGEQDVTMDNELILHNGKTISINLTAVPLLSVKSELIGSMLVIEDISGEKRMKGTLARYMTKQVADQLMENAETMLGGQIKPATVLFSDIRSFTTISEHCGPQETVSMLNSYFTEMVDIIFNHGGILDKYIGDAILAVFGAPFSTGRDADQAITVAVEMMRALKSFNACRCRENKPGINIGIGINTDEVLVGNIGSMKRMDYTVIGDGVNLASRLESATKYYGVNILISGSTLHNLTNSYLMREVDFIQVKGKTRPVAIYEVLEFHDDASFPHAREVARRFEEGLALYRQSRWNAAVRAFESALALHPGDKLSRMYVDRCLYLLENPPLPDWDGVWVMKEK